MSINARSTLERARFIRRRSAAIRDGELGRDLRVVQRERAVRADRRAAGDLGKPREQIRREALADDPGRGRVVEGARDRRVEVDRRFGGDRVADEHAAAVEILPVRAQDRRELGGPIDDVLEPDAGARRIERRQLGRAPADDEHAERLEQLHRARQIEDRLRAGRDDGDRRARQRDEIVRDVAGIAAMNAADAAGREDPDAGMRRDHGRRAHRRRRRTAPREMDRQIGRAGLREIFAAARDSLERGIVEPDVGSAVEHGDRRRNGPAGAHGGFELACDGEIIWPRQAVRDDRRLERDDRRGGIGDFGVAHEIEHVRMIARVSSTTRMLVLGVVRIFQPVHGYDVRRELVQWHAAEWGNVAPGSIYSALKTLVKEEIIEIASTEHVGGRPERTSYRLTPRGERELGELLRDALWTVKMPVDPLVAVVSVMGFLKRDELIAALEARSAQITGAIAHADHAINAVDDIETPAHVREMLRLLNARMGSELAWSKAFVARLRAGE